MAVAAAVVVLLAGFGVWYFALRDRGPKDDLGRFQGEWAVTIAAREAGEKEAAPAVVIRVEGDRWTYAAFGRETAARIVLNPAAEPKEIDLVRLGPDGQPLTFTHGEKGAEVRQQGVYAFEGDTIKLALAPYPQPRPKALDPAEAPVWVLTRVKK